VPEVEATSFGPTKNMIYVPIYMYNCPETIRREALTEKAPATGRKTMPRITRMFADKAFEIKSA
jgi:predicted nucleic acid-binding Zn ribbon protein